MRFVTSFCLSVVGLIALLAADPQQPKVGNTQVINATNGYGGILTVRTQVNVGYAGEPGILTLQSTNGTYTLTIQYDTDGALVIQPESLDAFDVPALRVKPGTALTMGNIQDWEDGNGVLRMSLEIEGTLFTRRLFAINDGIPNGDQWTRIQYGDITIHPDLGTNTILISAIDHSITMWQSGVTNFYVAPSSGNDGTAGLFLAADGLYHAVTSPPGTVITPGDPTSLIGLTTVTGVSALYMRADSAPRINQAITPEWTGTHLWTEAPGSLAISVRPTGFATNNLTGKDSPFISLSALVWDGVASYSPSFFIANKAVSGSDSSYRLTIDSSEHAPVFTLSNNSGWSGTGQNSFRDNGTFDFQFDISHTYTNFFVTNLVASTDTDVLTIPSGYRGFLQFAASTTNATAITFLTKVKIGGTYYNLINTPSLATNSMKTLLGQAFVFEPGDIIAFNPDAAGMSVFGAVHLFPTNAPLKTLRLTSISAGDNTLYTVPANKSAVRFGPLGVNSFNSIPSVNGYQATGSPVTYSVRLGTFTLQSGPQSSSATVFPQLAIVPFMGAGDVVIVNSSSSASPQFFWMTVYETSN